MADRGERADTDSVPHPPGKESSFALYAGCFSVELPNQCPAEWFRAPANIDQLSPLAAWGQLEPPPLLTLVYVLGQFLCQEVKKVEESSLTHTISGNPPSHAGKRNLQLVPLDRCEG